MMIDLDEIEAIENVDELYCQFGAALLIGRMSYTSWCVITMYFGVYQRLDTAEIAEEFIQSFERIHRKPGDISWLSKLQVAICSIESNYTRTQQKRIGGILESSRSLMMEKSPKNRGTIVPTPPEF